MGQNPRRTPTSPVQKEQCRNMSGNVRKKETPLSAKQLQALPHLVSGKTFANAATAADVSERTVYRWMNDPEFKSAYLTMREVETEIASAELRGLKFKAAITLSRAMDHEDPDISLRAAQTAIKTSAKVEEAEDVKKVVRFLNRFAERDDNTITPSESRRFQNQVNRVTRGRL